MSLEPEATLDESLRPLGLALDERTTCETLFLTTPDGEVLGERVSGANDFYLHDALNSVVALVDSSGTIQDSYNYDPYGNVTTSTENVPNPFRYAGSIWDSQTGLYKMGARYYDPSVGRFTQTDSLGGGYSYASDDPVNVWDPTGLCPVDARTNGCGRRTTHRSPSIKNVLGGIRSSQGREWGVDKSWEGVTLWANDHTLHLWSDAAWGGGGVVDLIVAIGAGISTGLVSLIISTIGGGALAFLADTCKHGARFFWSWTTIASNVSPGNGRQAPDTIRCY